LFTFTAPEVQIFLLNISRRTLWSLVLINSLFINYCPLVLQKWREIAFSTPLKIAAPAPASVSRRSFLKERKLIRQLGGSKGIHAGFSGRTLRAGIVVFFFINKDPLQVSSLDSFQQFLEIIREFCFLLVLRDKRNYNY